MKKFLLFLLVPLFAFTQYSDSMATLDFKDLMSIDSKDAFLNQMFKHRYQVTRNGIDDNAYSLNPSETGASSSFAEYFEYTNTFWFQFVRTGTMYTGTPQEKVIIMENSYDNILNTVQKRCKYIGTETVGESVYAIYDCKKAKFDSNIGFTISGASGIISSFVKDK